MKYTNKFSLPQPFVDLVSHDSYDNQGSDFTTTGLLKPPRIVALERKHWSDLEEDVSDLVWRMSGQVRHAVLEIIGKRNSSRYIVEQRYFMHLMNLKVSGQIDLFDKHDGTLYDWKETSVWKGILGNSKDWERQANINRLLLQKAGVEVKRLANIAFFKDWKKREAKKGGNYPQCPIQVFELPMWTLEEADRFLRERIELHLKARRGEHEVCSPEERWDQPATFAVMKEGRKSAIKLHERRENAELHLKACDKKHYIQDRPGRSTRCEDYCAVAQFCDFGKKILENASKSAQEAEE